MRRWLSAVVVVFALQTGAGHAWADQHDEARAMFHQGSLRFRSGDYADALRYYRRAYARAAIPKILLSTAACLVQLRRYAHAVAAYRRYLETADDPQRAEKVRIALRALDKLVGTLHVAIGGPSVRIVVDGESVAAKSSPVRIPADPGPHTVVVKRAGLELANVRVRVEAGRVYVIPLRRRVEPRVSAAASRRTPSTPGTSSRSSDRRRTIAKWVAAAGAVAVGIGVKLGFDARRISDELSSHDGPWTRELLSRQQEGRSAERAMWLFTGVGAAAFVTGGAFYLRARRQGAGEKPSTRLTVTGSSTDVMFGVAGRF